MEILLRRIKSLGAHFSGEAEVANKLLGIRQADNRYRGNQSSS